MTFQTITYDTNGRAAVITLALGAAADGADANPYLIMGGRLGRGPSWADD